jgi:hypothetical protein
MVKRVIQVALIVLFMATLLVVPQQTHADSDTNPCLKPKAKDCTYGLPTFQYEALLGQMLANPTPNVRQLAIDETELGKLGQAKYRYVGGIAPLYDAPDGKPVGAIRNDFYTFPIGKRQGDWVQVGTNRWVKADEITDVASSTYSGVVIDQLLAYTMGWIVFPTRPSTIPGADPDPATPMLPRYQLINVFATITVGDWDWYLIGPAQWIEQRRAARAVAAQKPDGVKGRWIAVDLYDQVLTAYEDDRMVYATLVSTGMPRPGFGTNKGLFRIWARMKSDGMSGGMGGPDAYSIPNVPYVMYYDDQISIHGAFWHDSFGYRRSHGCVNMTVTDAHWVYDWTNGFYGDTWVNIYSSKNYIKTMPPEA